MCRTLSEEDVPIDVSNELHNRAVVSLQCGQRALEQRDVLHTIRDCCLPSYPVYCSPSQSQRQAGLVAHNGSAGALLRTYLEELVVLEADGGQFGHLTVDLLLE